MPTLNHSVKLTTITVYEVLLCSCLGSRATNNESMVSDVSVMRDEACQAEASLLNPVTLDFERNSCLESDPR